MGRRNKKRSYAEYGKDVEHSVETSNVGLASMLRHLRNPGQFDPPQTTGSPSGDDEDATHPPGDWTLIDRKSKKPKRKASKSNGDVSSEYPAKKKDNRPAVTCAQLHRMQSCLKISDLQSLVLYCLADGTSPQWISVRHHNQIRKVVVLLVPGLEKGMFDGDIKFQDMVSETENHAPPSIVGTTAAQISTDVSSSTCLNTSQSGSSRSPDEYLPISLAVDKLPSPLKPFADMFSQLWTVKAPGDDKYNKVHSPLHAMLAAPIPKSQEERDKEGSLKGPKPAREVPGWKNERTPITRFILSNEDLLGNEYTLHPLALSTEQEKEVNCKRREKAGQLEANGWMDTILRSHDEANVPDADVQCESLTLGRSVLALDCEMCMVEGGEFALTRISVVNWDGEVIMDELVMPDKPITDYLTQYSGMTAAKLATITTTLSDVQQLLLKLFTPRAILVGHSLNADLTALKITHPFIIDTALLYPHPRGPPLKSSLRYLVQKYLGREIQKDHGTKGHDSIEDARACLDLVKQKCEKGLRWGTNEATSESIFKRLSRINRPGTAKDVGLFRTGAIIDLAGSVRTFSGVADVCLRCENDDEVVAGVKRVVLGDEDGVMVPGGGVDFTWARLHELEALRGWSNDAVQSLVRSDCWASDVLSNEPTNAALATAVSRTVRNITSIHATLPPCTLFIVYSGTGDRRDMAKLQKIHGQFKKEYALKKWDELSVRWTDVEEQALRRACGKARQGIGFVSVT